MGISKNLIEAVVVCEKSSDSDSFILRNCNFIAMNFLAQINVDYPGRRPQAPACFKYLRNETILWIICKPNSNYMYIKLFIIYQSSQKHFKRIKGGARKSKRFIHMKGGVFVTLAWCLHSAEECRKAGAHVLEDPATFSNAMCQPSSSMTFFHTFCRHFWNHLQLLCWDRPSWWMADVSPITSVAAMDETCQITKSAFNLSWAHAP